MHIFLLKVTFLCLSVGTVLRGQNIQDVQITVKSHTVTVTWTLQTHVEYTYVGIRYKDRSSSDLVYGYINQSSSTFTAKNKLHLCYEYTVRLQNKYSNGSYSSFVQKDFSMTDEIHRALVGNSQTITMDTDTPLSGTYDVRRPSGHQIPTSENLKTIPNYSFGVHEYNKVNIQVRHVDESAAGLYTIVTKSPNSRTAGCALLIVWDIPKTPNLSVHPTKPIIGEKAKFTCKSTVQRWPKSVPSRLNYTFNELSGIQDGDTLVVNVSDKLQGAQPTCIATDDYGGVSNKSNAIIIDPYCPPKDIEFDRVIIGTMKGAVENITVIVMANPKPSIVWNPQFSSSWVISEEGHNKYKGVSQIKIVNEWYFRSFVVQIQNSYGTRRMNVTIKAAGKPDPVQNITLKELFHNSARISFIAGFDGGEIQQFTLKCTPTGAAGLNVIQETIMTNINRKGLTVNHTIKGLHPKTHYNMTIISGNIYGYSSAFTYFKTITEPASNALIPLPVIIGGSVGMVLFLVVVIVLLKRCKKSKKDNCPRNNSPGPDEATSPREGSDTEYACVSKEEKTIESAAGACGGDEYACVVKEPSTPEGATTASGDNEYAAVDKTGTIKGSIEVHQRQSSEIPVRLQNDDGLLYIQVEFANRKSTKPKDDKPAVRGDDSRTDYIDIDFTKRADPLPESDKDEDDDEKKEEHPDM